MSKDDDVVSYVPKSPMDLLKSEDWNEMQVQARKALQKHNHSGKDEQGNINPDYGQPLTASGIADDAITSPKIVANAILSEHLNKDNDITANSLILNDSLTVNRDISIKGNLEVTGKTISRDVEQMEGDVILGNDVGDQITVKGQLSAVQAVHLNNNLTVEGDTVAKGKVTLGDEVTLKGEAVAEQAVHLNNNLTVEGDTVAKGKVTLGDAATDEVTLKGEAVAEQNATFKKNVNIDGDFTVKGKVISKDVEQMEGDVVLGNEDSDKVTVAGTIKTSHSSKKLVIDDNTEIKGNLKLASGVAVNEFSNDTKLNDNSDTAIPTEKAVKTYTDNKVQETEKRVSDAAIKEANKAKEDATEIVIAAAKLATKLGANRISGIVAEYYRDIGGGFAISDLTSSFKYINNEPDEIMSLSSFEIPSNKYENYGVKLFGILMPPENGEYTFWVAGDDNVELWLSTDSDPKNKKKIAYHTHYTASREWDVYTTQKSELQYLRSDEVYYIEALMKEGGSVDCLAVAWASPSIDREIIKDEYFYGNNEKDGEFSLVEFFSSHNRATETQVGVVSLADKMDWVSSEPDQVVNLATLKNILKHYIPELKKTSLTSLKLTAADGASGDWFGYSVALSGERIVIGAFYDDDNGSASGSAYVFEREGGTWQQKQKLTAADGASGDRFGFSVAISGERIVVTTYGDDDKGDNSGSAYVFENTYDDWLKSTTDVL